MDKCKRTEVKKNVPELLKQKELLQVAINVGAV